MPSPQVRKGLGQPWLLDVSFRGDGAASSHLRGMTFTFFGLAESGETLVALFHSPLNARSSGGGCGFVVPPFVTRRSVLWVARPPQPRARRTLAPLVGTVTALTRTNNGLNGTAGGRHRRSNKRRNSSWPWGPPRAWQTNGRRANSLKQSRQAAAPAAALALAPVSLRCWDDRVAS